MLLIQNGLLFTMEKEAPERADLLIRDGKIAKIAPEIRPDGDTEVFDATGLRVYPGLIDAHSHIGIASEKTTSQVDETNEGTTPVTPCMRAIDAINPMTAPSTTPSPRALPA